jgi:hypothetical protein
MPLKVISRPFQMAGIEPTELDAKYAPVNERPWSFVC